MAENLTPREKQAARLAAMGASNREVSVCMGVTVPTVEQYLNRVYEKLAIHSRYDLVKDPALKSASQESR
jgi:DNA-binding CsgD family transcriptional regulator